MEKRAYIISEKSASIYTVTCGSDACNGCKSKMFCTNPKNNFEAYSRIECKPGDCVRINMNGRQTNLASLLVFALPLALMFMAVAIGTLVFHAPMAAAIAALLTLPLSFLIVSGISSRARMLPEITEVINDSCNGNSHNSGNF